MKGPALDLTVVPTNCNTYYRCTSGQLNTLSCPSGNLDIH